MGPWPAKQIVLAAGEEDGDNLPRLTANNIDVYTAGTPGKGTHVSSTSP